jgi:hypothetical protein
MTVREFLSYIDLLAFNNNELTMIIPIEYKVSTTLGTMDVKIVGQVIIDNSGYSIHDKKLYAKYGIIVKLNEYGEPDVKHDKYGYQYIDDIKGNRYFLVK